MGATYTPGVMSEEQKDVGFTLGQHNTEVPMCPDLIFFPFYIIVLGISYICILNLRFIYKESFKQLFLKCR